MRIAIVNDILIGGGVEKVLFELANHLANRKHKVYVFAIGTREEANTIWNTNVKFIPKARPSGKYKPWSIKWFADRILSFFCRIRYLLWRLFVYFDLAIAIKEGESMIEVSRMKASKRVGWVHVDYCFLHWTSALFSSVAAELKCMKRFNRIICVSNAVRDSIIQTIGNPGNIMVCYIPINYRSILDQANSTCSIVKPKNKMLFVTVGRLDKHKQYSMLVDICSELEKEYSFELWIIGQGREKSHLDEEINNKDISSVKLLGYYDNPYPFIKMADCYICSSISESYGLAIQEALILKVPVIATRCPAIEETLDSRFGIISDNMFDGLKNAMISVLEKPTLLNSYKNAITNYYQTKDLYEERLNAIYALCIANE